MTKTRRTLHRAAASVLACFVGLGGTGVALLALAAPAFAAGVFVSPADNFTYAADAAGNPIPQDVVSANFPAGTNVFVEICDGKSPSAQGYDVTIDCDNVTSPTQIQSQGLSYQEMFTKVPHNEQPLPFRGQGGSDVFNCLAPEDVKAGTNPNLDGSVTPIGTATKNGNVLDPLVPSWTNCKVKISSNNASNTADQSFITFALSNGGSALQQASISPVAGNPTSSTVGTPVTLSTTVTGTSGHPTPTGTVTFDLAGTAIGGSCSAVPVGANGAASCTTAALPAGTDSLTALYGGDTAYGPVTSTAATYTVGKATPTVGLTSVPPSQAGTGSTATFKATVAGTAGGPAPTGTVGFTADGTAIAGCGSVPLVSGSVTCTTSFPTAGNKSIAATYSADTNYTAGTPATETFKVVPLPAAKVAVTSMPATSTYGQAVSVTATVTPPVGTTGTPTGTVGFTTGPAQTPIAGCAAMTVTANGMATCPLATPLPAGSTAVNAAYSGDTNYGGSTGTTTVIVAKASPDVSLSSIPTASAGTGSSVTFTARVSAVAGASAPAGTVAFTVGGAPVTNCGAAPVASGTATCTTSFPSPGSQSVLATYSGDTNYTAGTPATETFNVVNLPSANVAVTAAPLSSTSGQAVTLSAALTAPTGTSGTPTGTVSFTVSGTAFDPACTSVSLANGSATCSTGMLPVGSDTVTAAYSGDSAFAAASGTTTETVSQAVAAATVTLAPPTPASPQVAGTSVRITATVVAAAGTTPAGTVDFTAALPNATAADIAGCTAQPVTTTGGSTTAVCTTSALATGVNTLVATYKPTTGTNVSSSPINFTINAAPVTSPPSGGTPPASNTPATSPVAATSGSGSPVTSGTADTSGGTPSAVAAGSGGQAAPRNVAVPLAATLTVAGLGLLGEAWRRRRCG